MSATEWSGQGWSSPGVPAAPPAPPRPPVWSAPTHPGPATSLMAVLAICAAAAGTTIFFGLGSIAAIVLGFIALAKIRRTGEDGRLLAIWAIVLGGVTIAAIIASTIIGFVGFISIGQQFAQMPGF